MLADLAKSWRTCREHVADESAWQNFCLHGKKKCARAKKMKKKLRGQISKKPVFLKICTFFKLFQTPSKRGPKKS
jgi:hypothetical protein